jgi:fused signal recognition particle receptor
MNLFAKLKDGLSRTRKQIAGIVGSGDTLDDTFIDQLEEALIAADLGVDIVHETLDMLRDEIRESGIRSKKDAYAALRQMLVRRLKVKKTFDDFPPKPWVILVVGVNGVGKTTTIGKMAHRLKAEGKSVMLGAADTFRAGAVEQLTIWAQRTGSEIISQQSGSDAASVAFDAIEAARARGTDVLILDTAGRLHNKSNLMVELEKIVRVIKRNTPHAPNEILLVVDGTTGQNALNQAKVFNESLGITGLIITKLDGTSKGGMAIAMTRALGVPISKVGVGEGIDDLQDFDPQTYVDAMFGEI